METITNVASTAATTVSNIIYGQKDDPKKSESHSAPPAGKEPLSGHQGKGTAAEPYDLGNAETPTLTTNDAQPEDFLKLNPAVGEPAVPEEALVEGDGLNDAAATTETGIPVLPLQPGKGDVGADSLVFGAEREKEGSFQGESKGLGVGGSTLGTGSMGLGSESATLGKGNTTSGTGSTSLDTGSTALGTQSIDKAKATDTIWKPTVIDEVKPSGAPGAGPEAPLNVKPAAPAGYETPCAPKEESTHAKVDSANTDAAKTSTNPENITTTSAAKESTHAHQELDPNVKAILDGKVATQHTIPDEEANDPHSKMVNKTQRHTEPSQPASSANEPKVPSTPSKNPESSPSHGRQSLESSSPAGSEGKDSKIHHLKDKLKTKLHIGSKDKD